MKKIYICLPGVGIQTHAHAAPWNIRNVICHCKVGTNPFSTVAKKAKTIPNNIIFFRPTLSDKMPAMGDMTQIPMAMAEINPPDSMSDIEYTDWTVDNPMASDVKINPKQPCTQVITNNKW